MNRSSTSLLLAMLLYILALPQFSCSKEKVIEHTRVLRLSRVVNLILGDPGYNKPVLEVRYKGKEISGLTGYRYGASSTIPYTQLDTFIYDASGLLNRVESSYTTPPGGTPVSGTTSATFGYNGGVISSVTTYKGGSIFLGYTFSFTTDSIKKIIITSGSSTNVSEYKSDVNGNIYTRASTPTFDTKNAISLSLPNWYYFYTQQLLNTSTHNPGSLGIINGIFWNYPCKNNLLTNGISSSVSYSYQYNQYDLPKSVILAYSWITQTYGFEYIEIPI